MVFFLGVGWGDVDFTFYKGFCLGIFFLCKKITYFWKGSHWKRQVPDRSIAQLAGAVEYTDCIFAEGLRRTSPRPRYYTKQSDGQAPVMLKLCGMRSTPSLPSLTGPFWPRVVTPDRVLSMSQIELLDHLTVCKRMSNVNNYNHFAVCKQMIIIE